MERLYAPLVVTYDYQFDPAKGDVSLPIGGVHTMDAERETGSIAVTTAASLQLRPQTVSDTLRRVDETELSAADRSFISRAVVLAWQYAGSQYDLTLDVRRYATLPVLEAVADRTQIRLAARLFADDNNNRLPTSFDEMKNELGSDRITYDTETGQRYTYLGGGMALDKLKPDSVLAYSPIVEGHCEVLFADGSVEQTTAERFAQLSQRGLVQLATPQKIAQEQQRQAIARGQFVNMPAVPPPAQMPAGSLAGGGEINSMTASGGTMPVVSGIPATPSPAVAGIHSLRIEIPQTGQPFLLTKVLNVGDEPLSIRARIMPLSTFQIIQMIWQSLAFVVGLAVWWWQWRREDRSSFILTVALALIIGSVCSLLVQWRALHDVLIIGFPVVTLAIIAWLVWRYWPRRHTDEPTEPPANPPTLGTGIPPVAAAIALLFALSMSNATAANSAFRTPHSKIPNVSIVSATYSGTVNDRVARLNATLQLSSDTTGQIVPLFGSDVAVEEYKVKCGNADLIRDGNGVAVKLNRRGEATLQVRLLIKVAGDVTKRRLTFGIPPALSSQVAFTLDESHADVDFPTAISFKRTLDKDKTRVEAVIGSGNRVELLWTPRVKRAAEIAATVFCRNDALVTFGGGVVNVRDTLDYQITQGELRQARIQLPAGQRLLRVEGKEIRTWEVKNAPLSPQNGERVSNRTGKGQVLVVDLLKGVSSSWRLTIETEKILPALPTSEAVVVPHALGVMRETGLVALQGTEELGLSVESMSGLERVDTKEFTQDGTAKTGKLFSVFRFSVPDFALRVRAETIQPEIEAVVRNNFRVSAEQLALSATIDYTIKRAGVFNLRVNLPDGYRIERVTGDNILQYTERAGASRILEVTLKDRTSGNYTLGIELNRYFKELPKSLTITGVHPLDTAKLTGFIAVASEPGVAVNTESFDGLTEIPAVSLPDYAQIAGTGSVLAYKFISSEPTSTPAWQLRVATEAIPAWVRAEVVNTFAVTETLVNGRALVRYDIANAPIKELRVKVPAEFRNVEISGSNIRSRELVAQASRPSDSSGQDARATNEIVWRVELQSPTRGFYTLTVTWDQPRPAKTNAMEIAGVSAAGVERETGVLAISAKAPLQVSELSASDLQRVDIGDVPDWAGKPGASTALVYHYARPGYKLVLDVQRYAEAEVLQALVDSAQLSSVMADDGQMMTEMSLSVRNNGRQFLEIELPPGATVWSAFVAGQAVRPSWNNGKLLLPIEQSGVDDGAMTVELTYVGTNAFPRKHGTVDLVSPRFDVPLKNARWSLYLPPDYDYTDFRGTMTRETDAAPEASSKSFSQLEYSRMEQLSKRQAEVEVQRDVSEARQQLASGNVREASVNFKRARTRGYATKAEGQAVQQLEKDLQNAQASNLIQAQREFSLRNGAQQSVNAPAQADKVRLLYNSAAAERQWTKLQQAQEIVAAQVRPLHVNLPVRGTCYVFSQVLQTEPGKPMTILMQADNTKAISWPKRILTIAGAFLVLWVLVAIVSHLTLGLKST